MRCHSNQWPCSYFLLCLAFFRHYLKTGKSILKVYIFWEGHKNLKKTLTWFWWKVEDFFSNLATFSQFMNFNMQTCSMGCLVYNASLRSWYIIMSWYPLKPQCLPLSKGIWLFQDRRNIGGQLGVPILTKVALYSFGAFIVKYTMACWWCCRRKHPGSTHGCFLEK